MITFVDTNVLVYARDVSVPDKHRQARAWMEHLWSAGDGRISTQVLSEYYVTVTRKLKPGLPTSDARADINDLTAWSPQPIDSTLIKYAFMVENEASLSHWDALIVAAAARTGCSYLLSEDLNDGQVIDTITVLNPFTNQPPGGPIDPELR